MSVCLSVCLFVCIDNKCVCAGAKPDLILRGGNCMATSRRQLSPLAFTWLRLSIRHVYSVLSCGDLPCKYVTVAQTIYSQFPSYDLICLKILEATSVISIPHCSVSKSKPKKNRTSTILPST